MDYKTKIDGMVKLDILPQSRFFMPVEFEDERNLLFGRAEVKQVFDDNGQAIRDGGFIFLDIQDLFSLRGRRFIEVYPFMDVYSIMASIDVQVYLTGGVVNGAMYEFNTNTVDYFINCGVVIKDKKKLFYKALNNNDIELLTYLINNGLIPSLEDCESDPYYFAIQNNNLEMLKLLVSITKDKNNVNWDNMLRIVIYVTKDYNIALYLINELGANLNYLAIITRLRFKWWCFRHGHKIRK